MSAFELSDSLKEQGRKYDVIIPWFIMTSEENNKETVEFFAKHRNLFCFCRRVSLIRPAPAELPQARN